MKKLTQNYSVRIESDKPFLQKNQIGSTCYVKHTALSYTWDGAAWVPSSAGGGGGAAATFTGEIIPLDNVLGTLQTAPANTSLVYTTEFTVLNAYVRVVIDAASEPTITGATKIFGHTFVANTNMYMTAWYNGTRVEYWFEAI